MAFLAGEDITAGRLNRLQPKKYIVYQTSTLTGAVTNTLVPGCTISITNETAGATWTCWWALDFDLTSATTSAGTGRARVDGILATTFGVYAAEVTTDRATPGNFATGTLATAAAHTFELVATLPANMQLATQSALLIEITEVV